MMQWSRNLRQSMNSGKAASICPLFYILWYPSAESHKYRKKIKSVIEFPAELAECVFAMAGICFGETLSRNRPWRKKYLIMILIESWWEGIIGLTRPRERKQIGIRVVTSSCGWHVWRWGRLAAMATAARLHMSGMISNEWQIIQRIGTRIMATLGQYLVGRGRAWQILCASEERVVLI